MAAILEMTDSVGGRYMSLPKYKGCFKMPREYPDPYYQPEPATYRRDQVEDITAKWLQPMKGCLMISV
ncbi:hypothetical protein Bca52824_003151 [Brassica carinata]|uniref:Uncharacterized protein n=1 Tax=Brassica carinata TaxID=52824 RepID=A0A8X7WM51_BRACI|nr:hypothetical protein Bca52824_003151 [Brassica carinata]